MPRTATKPRITKSAAERIAANVKRLRVDADLTQMDLAVLAELTVNTVYYSERADAARGKSIETLEAIARALHCTVDDLLAA